MVQNLTITKKKSLFVHPLEFGGEKSDFKHSHLLEFNYQGHTFNGEYSHIPLFHHSEEEQDLERIRDILSNNINWEQVDFERQFFNVLPCEEEVSSTALFAIESILFNIAIHKRLITINHDLPVRTNSLIWGDSRESNSSKCVKIKIGRKDPTVENQFVLDFLKANPASLLRLDGNRKLTNSTLKEILNNVPMQCLDYIEDPFIDINELTSCPFPLALDESFKELQNKMPQSCIATVYKPTVHGGISGYIKRKNSPRFEGLKHIISATFEYKVGMSILKGLAQWQSPNDYHGLDTDKFLAETIILK